MPWRCPACSTPIRHNEFEPKPQARTPYRCHICRLELVVDEATDKLVVAPIRTDPKHPSGPPQKQS